MLEDRDEVSCPLIRDLFHKRWFVLIMWQVCSFFLCAMGVVVTLIDRINGSTLTFFQLLITYGMLSLANIWNIEYSDIELLKYI